MSDTIQEKVSKKQKRGRPKGMARNRVERYSTDKESCLRTRMNWSYSLSAIKAVTMLEETGQRTVWGCTFDEIRSGRSKFPKGWTIAANEIGRVIASRNQDADSFRQIASLVADARREGVGWRDIAAHFRKMRLGKRTGNADAVRRLLARTLADYQRRYPATEYAVILEALEKLAAIVRENIQKSMATHG